MTIPSVSILIPAYNAQRFLAPTLQSLLAQDRPDWECIILDDGSSDDTPKIARDFASRDPRFRFFTQKNAGVAATRTRALELSNPAAPFALFLDNDDLLAPNCLSRLLIAAQSSPDLTGAHCLADMIDADGRPIGDSGFANFQRARRKVASARIIPCSLDEPSSFAVMLITVVWPPAVFLLKKSALHAAGPFDPSLRAASDWDMWIRVAREGPIAFLNEILVSYRRHDQNESNVPAYIYRETRYVRKKAFFDKANSPAQKTLAQEAYRAWQLTKIDEKRAALRTALPRFKLLDSSRLLAHIALHALFYLRGYPTLWG